MEDVSNQGTSSGGYDVTIMKMKQQTLLNFRPSSRRQRLDTVFSIKDDILLARGIIQYGNKWKQIWQEYDLKHIKYTSLKDRARSKGFKEILKRVKEQSNFFIKSSLTSNNDHIRNKMKVKHENRTQKLQQQTKEQQQPQKNKMEEFKKAPNPDANVKCPTEKIKEIVLIGLDEKNSEMNCSVVHTDLPEDNISCYNTKNSTSQQVIAELKVQTSDISDISDDEFSSDDNCYNINEPSVIECKKYPGIRICDLSSVNTMYSPIFPWKQQTTIEDIRRENEEYFGCSY